MTGALERFSTTFMVSTETWARSTIMPRRFISSSTVCGDGDGDGDGRGVRKGPWQPRVGGHRAPAAPLSNPAWGWWVPVPPPCPSHCSQVPPLTLSPLTFPKDERPWCWTGSLPVSTSQLSALQSRRTSGQTPGRTLCPPALALSPPFPHPPPLGGCCYQGVLQLWVRVM